MPVVAALAAGILVVGVAWLGPRLTQRPSLDLSFLPTPTPTVEPSFARPIPSPSATPLPAITRGSGPQLSGQVPFLSTTINVVDLGSGLVRTGDNVQVGRDAIFAAPTGDGWWCLCITDGQTVDHQVRRIDLVRFDAGGTELTRAEVTTIQAAVRSDEPVFALPIDVEIGPDRRTALVATGALDGRAWTISVLAVDLEAVKVTDTQVLGSISAADLPAPVGSPRPSAPTPSAGPPDRSNLSIDGPHIRLAPDGRSAAVWTSFQQSQPDDGSGATVTKGWMISLGPNDATISSFARAPALSTVTSFCNQIAFATAERLIWSCPTNPIGPVDPGRIQWVIGTIGLDGRVIDTTEIPTDLESYYAEPLLDTANGLVYLWDPLRLVVVRIDAATLRHAEIRLDPNAVAGPGVPPLGGGSSKPSWHDTDSSVDQYQFHQLAGAPDSSRLYLLGFANPSDFNARSQSSLGIFVVDASTLALTGHWAPAADYISIAPVGDGHLIAASGLSGNDTLGRPAGWEASISFHDAVDGRIVLRLGRLGTNPPQVLVR